MRLFRILGYLYGVEWYLDIEASSKDEAIGIAESEYNVWVVGCDDIT